MRLLPAMDGGRAFLGKAYGRVSIDDDRVRTRPAAFGRRLDEAVGDVTVDRVRYRWGAGVRVTTADGSWWVLWTRRAPELVEALRRAGAQWQPGVTRMRRRELRPWPSAR